MFSLSSSISTKISPLVVFSILDHYKRRGKDQERALGTLLGERVGNTVFIKNCFPGTMAGNTFDWDYHRDMLELHKQVNPKELIVGWYATAGDDIPASFHAIHDEFRKQMVQQGPVAIAAGSAASADPVFLTVDTSLTNSKLGVKAFTGRTVLAGSDGQPLLGCFEPSPLDFHATVQEKIGVDALISSQPDQDDKSLDAPSSLMTNFEALELSMNRLLEMIKTAQTYVHGVAEGKIQGNPSVGRAIANALSAIPHFDPVTFNKIFNENVQDLLMVVYLSNLTKTQIAVADKLSAQFE